MLPTRLCREGAGFLGRTHDPENAGSIPAPATNMRFMFRPLLVPAILAKDAIGPLVLIDNEQSEAEQIVSIWHELMHVIGVTDERQAEALAQRLAPVCPEILEIVKSKAAPWRE